MGTYSRLAISRTQPGFEPRMNTNSHEGSENARHRHPERSEGSKGVGGQLAGATIAVRRPWREQAHRPLADLGSFAALRMTALGVLAIIRVLSCPFVVTP